MLWFLLMLTFISFLACLLDDSDWYEINLFIILFFTSCMFVGYELSNWFYMVSP